MFSHQQQQNAYKKLPPEIQDLIRDGETTELIAETLKEVGLDTNQANLADSEILYVMYCLQSLDDAINNIAKISGKSVSDLEKLKSTVQTEILDKYKIDIKDFIESNKSGSPVISKVAPSKEDVKQQLINMRTGGAPSNIPEIAPEVHPMVETSTPITVNKLQQTQNPNEPVIILNKDDAKNVRGPSDQNPTGQKVSLPDYRYDGGKDPYREPLK